MITPQTALVYTMVIAAESDGDIAGAEVKRIGDLVDHLPIFKGVGRPELARLASSCSETLAEADAIEDIFDEIRDALSPALRETAYALACDVIAADRRLNLAEMKTLERIRVQLAIDPSAASVIERAAQVRFQAA